MSLEGSIMKLTNEELYNLKGGGITASLLNAISRTISTMLNLGQVIGSAIRRVMSKKSC